MIASLPWFGSGTAALKLFLEDLGAEVRLSPPPTRRTMELGVLHAPEQICLPFKISLGNMLEAAEAGADTVFMAAGTRKCRFGYYHLLQERILARRYPNVRLFALSQYSATDFVFRKIPEIFGVTAGRSLRAVEMLIRRSELIHDLDNMVRRLRPTAFEASDVLQRDGLRKISLARTRRALGRVRRELTHEFKSQLRGTAPALRIGLVGEVYMMIEPFANSEIERELGRLGALVMSERSLYRHIRRLLKSDLQHPQTAAYARRYIGESPGGEVTETLGEAVRFAKSGADGIIHIFPFTCMPENMALEMLQQISGDYSVPVMSLSFDEHTSRTGLVTRLEAFVDMIARKKLYRRAANDG